MSEQRKDGGPAFPVIPPADYRGGSQAGYPYPDDGMSLRDWFAGQVLSGIMSAVCDGTHTTKRGDETPPRFIARTAYGIADAMLAERAK